MHRRSSRTESSSSSDINFDDVDDQQVFAFLEDGDESRGSSAVGGLKPSKGVEFRLDLSSRINPAPMPLSPSRTVARSPRMRSQSISVKKPRARRPSTESPARLGSAVVSSTAAAAAPSSEPKRAALMSALAEAEATAAAAALDAEAKAKQHEDVVATLQSQLEQSLQERDELQSELRSARSTNRDLEQKVVATEQSSDLFARQLANVKESYQTKLLLRDEAMAVEKAAVSKEKESELQHQQTLFAQETELWKQQIAALQSAQMELQERHEDTLLALQDQKQENEELFAKTRALEAEQSQDREEIRYLSSWKEQYEHTLEDFDAKQAELEQENCDWAAKCEQLGVQIGALKQELDGLLLEREDRHASIQLARERFEREHADARVKLRNTACEIHKLRGLLRQVANNTRELLRHETQTTRALLQGIQEQAYELSIRHKQKEMTLATKQSRIIQLEAQLKNDKQAMNQLEAALAKVTRSLEKKDELFKAKYHEQKEHLEITLAVRHGLTSELQVKKQQMADVEKKLSQAMLAKDKVERKNKQLQQQLQIMQHTHVRELEKSALAVMEAKKQRKLTQQQQTNAAKSTAASRSLQAAGPISLKEGNNERQVVPPEEVSEEEWREFVELVAAYGEESCYSQSRRA